ncbi:MAG TPA: phosphotransferase family protein [Anaeromyxobacteraceae bacterium]|nr:phosphotransferase family protein [Anaeromyxobacteraceae bacterium]
MEPAAPPGTIGAVDLPGEVREEDRLDPERLLAFLRGAFPGLSGPVEVEQFRRGHSNLTYLLRFGGREAVLRRAPHGANVKTAHDMRREFTILSALQGAYPKAPRPLAFCDDPSVAGAEFYLMERVRGVIVRRGGLPGVELSPSLLSALSAAFVADLAALHAVDVRGGTLAGIGKPEGYVRRQVTGWTERYLRARTDEVPEAESVARWLGGAAPAESGAALVHNDFKYDNLVLDPSDLTRIVAVLDWEMATVGDPLMDLGTSLGYWVDPDDPPEMQALAFGPTSLPGNLDRRGVVARYATLTGRDPGPMLFQYAFALFKIAVIVQQIYKRFREGKTTDPRFAALGAAVQVLCAQAARAVEKGRIDGLG